MSMSRGERAAGVIALALITGGFVLVGVEAPNDETTRAELVATFGEDGTQGRQSAGVLLVALGACLFMPFLAVLRECLTDAAAPRSALPTTALAAGIVMSGALTASAVFGTAVPVAAGFFDAYEVNPDVALTGSAASFYMNGFATLAGGVLVAAVAMAAARAQRLPRWFTRMGYGVAAFAVPGMLLGFWIVLGALWIAGLALLFPGRAGSIRNAGRVTPGIATQQGG